MRFSLQDMARQTLAEANRREMVKRAQDEEAAEAEKKKGKQGPPAAAKSPPDNTSTAPERNEESYEEKTSSAFVEKLASAAEYLNENFLKVAVGEPEPPLSHSVPGAAAGIGPGAGAGATEVNSPTPGMQSTNTGQAKNNQISTNPGSDSKSPGQTNPATAMETDINDVPGGSEDWTNQDKMKQASGGATIRQKLKKVASVARVQAIMDKMAADSVSPSRINAGVTNPHQSLPEDASASEQGPKPSQPGEVTRQSSMVGSNQAAIDYTKQQAKAVPKARMGEVLSEPAQKKSTDPVLHENLDATSSAGVKLSSVTKAAAARSLLEKIAQEGAAEGASPEQKEKADKLLQLLQAKKQGKAEEQEEEEEEEEEQEEKQAGLPFGGGY